MRGELAPTEIEAQFVSRGGLSASARMRIYQHAYWMRQERVLSEIFTCFRALVGGERFHALAADYLRLYPSDRPAIEWIGRRLRSLRDRTLAEDLLQTTFTRLHAARTSYRPGSPVRPWLFTIAARVRSDELRRRQRREGKHDDTEPDELEDPASLGDARELERSERGEFVRRALELLPESQRVVLHLHRAEGMSFGEIARVLNVNEGAVRLRAFRAYASLRKLLGPLLDRPEREEER